MSVVIAASGAAILVALAVIDLRHRTVPNAIVLPSAAGVLAAQCATSPDRALEWTLASLGTFVFLLLAHVAYPSGLGMGDVKLGLLLGALLGLRTPMALLVGTLAVAAVGVVLILLHGAGARKTPLPFVPFLATGALAVLVATAGTASAAVAATGVRFAGAPRTALQGSSHTVSVFAGRALGCALSVRYSGGEQQALGTRRPIAGRAQWMWTVPQVAKAGPAELVVSCGHVGRASRRVTVYGDLVAPRIVVEKQGFSVLPRSIGSTASYGLMLRNTSPNVDALDVYVIVNFVMADGHLVGTSSGTIPAIPADSTFAYGGSLAFPGAAPVVSLEIVMQIGGVQRRAVHQPALENVRVVPNRTDATWVGEVDGELINDDPELELRSARLYTVVFDANGEIIGGGTGAAGVVLPRGTRAVFVVRSGLDAIPWGRAASAVVSAVPTYSG